VREFMNDWDRGNIHGVASVGFERANAALAQNDFVVASGQQVFGRAQEFLDRSRDPALEQHRLANLARFRRRLKICMFRAPTWKMSTYGSISSICEISITSLITSSLK